MHRLLKRNWHFLAKLSLICSAFALLGNGSAAAQNNSSYVECLRDFKCDQAIRKLVFPLNNALAKKDYALAGKIMRMIALAFRLDENDQAAAQAAELAMKLDPEDEYQNFQLAEYELRNGNWKKADSIFEQLSKSKDSKIAERARAFLAQQKGSVLQAMELLEDYVKKYPEDERAILRLTYLYLVNEEEAKAHDANLLLSKLSATSYLKEIYLGRAAEAIHKLDAAEDHYRTAGRYKSDDPLWHSQLGLLFMKNQKIKEANQEFRSCFELKRLCGKAYTSWAVMQAFFGSKKNADECLARLQELRPNFNELYFVKGIVDEKAGDNQAAAKNFRKAIELYPHNSSPYIHLLQSPEFKIDINKKIELCKSWVENCPQSALAAMELGNASYHIADKDKALELLQNAEALVQKRTLPKDSNYQIAQCKLYASMADIYYDKDELEEAIAYASKFNQVRPELAKTAGLSVRPPHITLDKLKGKARSAAEHALLADALYEQGELVKSEQEYRKALSDDPKNMEYHSALLKVLLDKKDYAAAVSEDATVTQHVLTHASDLFQQAPVKAKLEQDRR